MARICFVTVTPGSEKRNFLIKRELLTCLFLLLLAEAENHPYPKVRFAWLIWLEVMAVNWEAKVSKLHKFNCTAVSINIQRLHSNRRWNTAHSSVKTCVCISLQYIYIQISEVIFCTVCVYDNAQKLWTFQAAVPASSVLKVTALPVFSAHSGGFVLSMALLLYSSCIICQAANYMRGSFTSHNCSTNLR